MVFPRLLGWFSCVFVLVEGVGVLALIVITFLCAESNNFFSEGVVFWVLFKRQLVESSLIWF